MPTVTYVQPDGSREEIQVENGSTVMQGAVDNMVPGVLADCGGTCSCATCHCYVDEAWIDKVGEPDEIESDMLTFVVDPKDNSRLTCQIMVTEQLDGLVVYVPDAQV